MGHTWDVNNPRQFPGGSPAKHCLATHALGDSYVQDILEPLIFSKPILGVLEVFSSQGNYTVSQKVLTSILKRQSLYLLDMIP